MKKTWLIPAVLGSAALLLSACTRSDSSTSTAGAKAASTDTVGAGTAYSMSTAAGADPVITLAGGMGAERIKAAEKETESSEQETQTPQTLSGTTTGSSTAAATPAQTQTTEAPTPVTGKTQTESAAPAGTAVSGTDVSTDNTAAGTVAPMTEAPQQEDNGEVESSAVASSSWVGTFTQSSGETLTVYSADSSGLSFGFAVCGVSGYASMEGGSAIYKGDDDYDVIFEMAGDVIYVNVTNANGYDTEGTPVVGNYVRQ